MVKKEVFYNLGFNNFRFKQKEIKLKPWGHYKILFKERNLQIKLLTLKPYASTSYQSHKKRSEYWEVISGTASVILEQKEFNIKSGDGINIPIKAKHRLINNTVEKLTVLEVQTGECLESDIIRYEDEYGRT